LREKIVARYPRKHFRENFIQEYFAGFAHKPGTTYGPVNQSIYERLIPSYKAPNAIDLIAGSPTFAGGMTFLTAFRDVTGFSLAISRISREAVDISAFYKTRSALSPFRGLKIGRTPSRNTVGTPISLFF
jgi:hypothetical protein